MKDLQAIFKSCSFGKANKVQDFQQHEGYKYTHTSLRQKSVCWFTNTPQHNKQRFTCFDIQKFIQALYQKDLKELCTSRAFSYVHILYLHCTGLERPSVSQLPLQVQDSCQHGKQHKNHLKRRTLFTNKLIHPLWIFLFFENKCVKIKIPKHIRHQTVCRRSGACRHTNAV